MSHASEATLVAYRDGELAPEERRALADHLEGCRRCAGRHAEVGRISDRLSAALAELDPPAPTLEAATLRRRAGLRVVPGGRGSPPGGGRASGPATGTDAPKEAFSRRRSLVAAILLLVAFTGAAAALPGSPLRAWLADSVRAIAAFFDPGEAPAPPALEPATDGDATPRSGVAVAPYGGGVRISLLSPSPETVIRVRLVDAPRASVLATGGTYRTGRGSLEVLDAGSGEVTIEIPRATRWAVVEVDGRPVVEKRDGDLRLLAPADTVDSEIFFRPSG